MSVYELDRRLVRELVESVSIAARGSARGPSRPGRQEGAGSSGVADATSGPSGTPPGDLDDDAVARLFATATWSALAEPGDAVAGLAVSALGADRALSMLLERRTPAEWMRTLGDHAGAVSEADLGAGLERWRPRLSSRLALAAFRSAANCSARLLAPGDTEWPRGFEGLGAHAPLALWVRGDARELSHAAGSIAIVGSRDATNYGEHMATELASGLSDRGFAVFSGAAYGIDGMAHRAALASRGTTVAFLAGGVDRLYPRAHHDLLLRVEATGAIVSELPCGSAPTKWRFLQRNRLIAAASDGTVVVEAGRRSGSLNTAGHAAALGRPLGAVPGPVTSVTSAGCHRLLREFDAVCVTSAAEVVELVLGPSELVQRAWAEHPPELGADVTRVLDALGRSTARTVDELAAASGMSSRAVAVALGELALDDRAKESPGGWRRT